VNAERYDLLGAEIIHPRDRDAGTVAQCCGGSSLPRGMRGDIGSNRRRIAEPEEITRLMLFV
jgi:hypothetical protein